MTPNHPTLAEVAADPIGTNSRLGRFTNMVNLLDLCAVAFPGPDRADGLPFGVQLIAPAGHDYMLIDLAAQWTDEVLLAVAGAHLIGQPLNSELVRRGARLVESSRTASSYRMYLVDGPRPGITPAAEGAELEVEVWALPAAQLGSFATTIQPPLAIGPLDLFDGRRILGFLTTADAITPANDITTYGGWRNYLASR